MMGITLPQLLPMTPAASSTESTEAAVSVEVIELEATAVPAPTEVPENNVPQPEVATQTEENEETAVSDAEEEKIDNTNEETNTQTDSQTDDAPPPANPPAQGNRPPRQGGGNNGNPPPPPPGT